MQFRALLQQRENEFYFSCNVQLLAALRILRRLTILFAFALLHALATCVE